MWLPLMLVVTLCFFGVVLFALHRKTDVNISMVVWRRLFEFTIEARDKPDPWKRRKVPPGASVQLPAGLQKAVRIWFRMPVQP
jgi:hypothetical protein